MPGTSYGYRYCARSDTPPQDHSGIRPRILQDYPCGGDRHEYVQWQAQVAAPEQCWPQAPAARHSPMPRWSFRSAGTPVFTIAASSPAVADAFLAGSLSPAAQTSMTTVSW